MPFTLKNLKQDVDDVGANFDGAPDLEFRLETAALGSGPRYLLGDSAADVIG